MEDLFSPIKDELYVALTKLGADKKLLIAVGNWRDSLPDRHVLDLLKELNAGKVGRGNKFALARTDHP